MNYATNTTTHSVDVGYYMPAGTQPLVEASTMVPTSLDDEVELDSPGFVSRELAAFSARGFQRRNRWAAKR